MDAIELLREDHQEMLAMLERLEAAPKKRDGASPEVLRARKHLVIQVVMAQSRHEAVEEEYFWPLVRKAVPDGERLAGRGVDQEAAAKYLLDALEKTGANQPDYDAMVERLVHDGREHIRYEQDEVWPAVRETISSDRLIEVGRRMAAAKARAPTRPHPDTPPAPMVLKTLGKVVALADRARDVITRRG